MHPDFRDGDGDGREEIRQLDKLLSQYEDDQGMDVDGDTRMISSLGDLSKSKSVMERADENQREEDEEEKELAERAADIK